MDVLAGRSEIGIPDFELFIWFPLEVWRKMIHIFMAMHFIHIFSYLQPVYPVRHGQIRAGSGVCCNGAGRAIFSRATEDARVGE